MQPLGTASLGIPPTPAATIAPAMCRASGDVPGDVPLLADALVCTRGRRHPLRRIARHWPAGGPTGGTGATTTEHDSRRRRQPLARQSSHPVRQARRGRLRRSRAPSSRVIAIAGIDKQAHSATHVHSTAVGGHHPVVNTASKGKCAWGSPWRTDGRARFAGGLPSLSDRRCRSAPILGLDVEVMSVEDH